MGTSRRVRSRLNGHNQRDTHMNSESPDTSPTIIVELEAQIARARESAQWKSGDRVALSIAKRRDLSVTLLMLRAGSRLAEHAAPRSITVQVLSGAVNFAAASAVQVVRAGMICVLDHQVPHAVEALKESVLLLTAGLGG